MFDQFCQIFVHIWTAAQIFELKILSLENWTQKWIQKIEVNNEYRKMKSKF